MNECLPVPIVDKDRVIDPVEAALYIAAGAEMGAVPEIVVDIIEQTLEPDSIEEATNDYGKEISPI
jgi:hypothetical protein